MRTLLVELRPANLVNSDLGDLIRQLAEGISGRSRVVVSLDIEGRHPLPPEVQMNFFRIKQETLNNIIKHARASQVKIIFRNEEHSVSLDIGDNGRGFDMQTMSRGRMGLTIIREHSETIGADLKVESQPGQGTHLEIRWSDDHEQGR